MSASPWVMPAGATDCHFHVFDDRFQVVPGGRKLSAPASTWQALREELCISRGVIVAPSSYGRDNACMFDALAQFARTTPAAIRAVAIPPADWTRTPWSEWHSLGVRGLRLYTGHADFPSHSQLRRLGAAAADCGWHLQLVGEREREPFPALAGALAALPCPIVFDHFGFAPQPLAGRSATADALRRLLDGGRAWVKLSGAYLQSRAPAPRHEDFDGLAHELLAHAPDRMLWGSDWPHTLAQTKPTAGDLLVQLRAWVHSHEQACKVLVDNPSALYWSVD